MRNQGTVLLRAHTDGGKTNKQKTPGSKGVPQPKWAPYALIIDTETTTDELQTLILLGYRFCKLDDQGYAGVEEGIVFPDGLPENDAAACGIVKKYQSRHQSEAIKGFSTKLKLHSRSEFFKQVFWRAVEKLGAVVVAFNLPFDLSRLAVDVRVSRKVNTGWTFVMSQDKCTLSGKLRADPMAPRVRIQPVDSKSAFIELTGVGVLSRKSKKRLKPFVRGRFLDLRTLGWALRNESFSLESASAKFLGSSKLNHQPCGKITREEIEYCRHDVRLTARLLNAMRDDFELHPIRLNPEQAYSPASIAKAYLDAMGIIPPSQKFQIPDRATGVAMQTYCGGRAECRIRHVVVPVVHTDVLSEYPTINPLSGLWSLLTAKELRFEDATPDVRRFLSHVTPELVCQPEFWKELRFFALVKPNHTILPVRANYAATNSNIGVNPLTSNVPIWYAGPDLVAAILAGSEPPEIIEALRMVSEGQQAGLKPVTLRGSVFIDPSKSDFFRLVIESRQRIKKDSGLPKSQRDALGYFLKILANAGSYGLFVEVNPEVLPKGKRHKIKVFSGEVSFSTTTPVVERPGTWYCPPIAALITAGGRLLLESAPGRGTRVAATVPVRYDRAMTSGGDDEKRA